MTSDHQISKNFMSFDEQEDAYADRMEPLQSWNWEAPAFVRSMRVLVCGGREGWQFRESALDKILSDRGPLTAFITGGGTGVDYYAWLWASRHCPHERIVFKADWKSMGKAAGPIRNQKMIDEGKPDLVVAFRGGRGTADMVRRAKLAKIEVIEIDV
jgi:hypothetical protein